MKVYWSPVGFDQILGNSYKDWNLLYYEPESLLKNLSNKKSGDDQSPNLLSCPSFSSLSKNVFILENTITSHFQISKNEIISKSKSYVNSYIDKAPSIENNILFTYGMNWIFFTEEDSLEMSLTAPFFSQANHLNYGAVTPGKFDIGKYFRHITLEYNLWNEKNEFRVEEGEPLAYVSFNTSQNVELVRFTMNDKLLKYASAVSNFTDIEPRVSLKKRYERFKKAKMKELIMKEIFENVVEKKY
jgi:hypothetical protein